jgi:FkbM family methyltransferase
MRMRQHQSGMLESILRGIPDFRGKRRMAKYLFQSRIKEGKDLLVVGKDDCLYKLPNLSDSLALDIFVNGIYEEDTHDFLLANIRPNSLFLDLGANIGSIAVPLCKKRTDIKCIAVEAAPWIFEYLNYNIRINSLDDRIHTVNKAIAEEEGGKIAFYSPIEKFGKGSLSPLFTDKAIMVDRITINTLLRKFAGREVSTIKIDIEGFEYFAFMGGNEILQCQQAPDIIFEFMFYAEEQAEIEKGAAQKLLMSWGYKLSLMEGRKLVPLENPLTEGGGLIFASKR